MDKQQFTSDSASDLEDVITVNLHRFQAIFLQELARVTQLPPSVLCARLIGLASLPETERRGDLLYGASVRHALKSYSRSEGDTKWTKVQLLIADVDTSCLDRLALRSGESRSSKVRHVLADYMEWLQPGSRIKPSRKARRWRDFAQKLVAMSPLAVATLALFFLAAMYFRWNLDPALEVGPQWAARRAEVIFDPHTHSRTSDGILLPSELVKLAGDNGCNAMVLSDHSHNSQSASRERIAVINNLQQAHPDLVLFADMGLDLPSFGGTQRAGVILNPAVAASMAMELRNTVVSSVANVGGKSGDRASGLKMLQLAADYQSRGEGLLLIYKHPLGRDIDSSKELADAISWNSIAPVFGALEGAQGGGDARIVGGTEQSYSTEDHWDQVVAGVGGVWDQMWSAGSMIWGALASSNYHDGQFDPAPCAFARTHLVVPEKTHAGVIRALKAGTFWADHGRILDQLWLILDVDGLDGTAYPGTTIKVPSRGRLAVASILIERDEGSKGMPLVAEFIGNCPSGRTELLASRVISPTELSTAISIPLSGTGVDGVSCSIRARVRLERASGADYVAYTNPIRVFLE